MKYLISLQRAFFSFAISLFPYTMRSRFTFSNFQERKHVKIRHFRNVTFVVKAAGPDQFKPIVLQTLHAELAPILQVIFQKSLDSGKLPHILKEANVSPISIKGDKSDPANYHPISLTCVLCKVLEHIVASDLTKHLANSNIIFELQHGFREKRSCETQLVMLVDKIAKNLQMGK